VTKYAFITTGRDDVPPWQTPGGARRFWRRCLLGVAGLLAAGLSGCDDWPGISAGPTSGPTTQAGMPGVPGFAKVSPALYRGGQPTAEGFANLKRAGIRTVISLRTLGSDRSGLRGTGLRYVCLSCNHVHPEDEDVLALLKIVEDPANQPVLIHCRDGRDRTSMMVAAYRVLIQGWSKTDALAEMKRMGFDPFWSPLMKYVERMDVAGLKAKLHALAPPVLEVVE
jgi:protein tyrosine phosphatase (PTP) superfamily phosphohydrolase (DUF442 family)